MVVKEFELNEDCEIITTSINEFFLRKNNDFYKVTPVSIIGYVDAVYYDNDGDFDIKSSIILKEGYRDIETGLYFNDKKMTYGELVDLLDYQYDKISKLEFENEKLRNGEWCDKL